MVLERQAETVTFASRAEKIPSRQELQINSGSRAIPEDN
jgi:hypothetical protein